MAKTNSLTVRVSPALKKALERAAAADARSTSSMLVDRIASEWLTATGYLAGPNSAARGGRRSLPDRK